MDAEDVVVSREHVEGGRGTGGHLDGNLRVIDAGEVASAGRLVLLGLEREGVGVHTGSGAAGVMVVRLDLVEVLTLLLLEAVLFLSSIQRFLVDPLELYFSVAPTGLPLASYVET